MEEEADSTAGRQPITARGTDRVIRSKVEEGTLISAEEAILRGLPIKGRLIAKAAILLISAVECVEWFLIVFFFFAKTIYTLESREDARD